MLMDSRVEGSAVATAKSGGGGGGGGRGGGDESAAKIQMEIIRGALGALVLLAALPCNRPLLARVPQLLPTLLSAEFIW